MWVIEVPLISSQESVEAVWCCRSGAHFWEDVRADWGYWIAQDLKPRTNFAAYSGSDSRRVWCAACTRHCQIEWFYPKVGRLVQSGCSVRECHWLPLSWSEVRQGSAGEGVGCCFDTSVCAEVSKMIRTELRHCIYADVVLSWVSFNEERRFSRQPLARQMQTCWRWCGLQCHMRHDATVLKRFTSWRCDRWISLRTCEQRAVWRVWTRRAKTSTWRKLAGGACADWTESECFVARTWK